MSYSLVCESLEPRMRRVSTSPLLQRPRRWNLGEGLGEGLLHGSSPLKAQEKLVHSKGESDGEDEGEGEGQGEGEGEGQGEGQEAFHILPPEPGRESGIGGLNKLAAALSSSSALLSAWRGDVVEDARGRPCLTDDVDRFGCGTPSVAVTPCRSCTVPHSSAVAIVGMLHLAALGGHAEAIKTLSSTFGVDAIDARASRMGGATALCLAAARGQTGERAAIALLRAGASPAAGLTRNGLRPAHLAAWCRSRELLGELCRLLSPTELHAPCSSGAGHSNTSYFPSLPERTPLLPSCATPPCYPSISLRPFRSRGHHIADGASADVSTTHA